MSEQQWDNTYKIILFVNKSDNPKAPVLTGFVYDKDGNKTEAALWPATDNQGNKKTTAKGAKYFTGKHKPVEDTPAQTQIDDDPPF